MRAIEVSSPLLTRYIESRQKEGAKNATINRELAALKRMFNLGREHRKVREVPIFPTSKKTTFARDTWKTDSTESWSNTVPSFGFAHSWKWAEPMVGA